ncbi:hypothetical protein [Methylocystis parvus]|nr:hypothetical protein [Methylocystis parvus]WBK01307.1 hypothetical protein MMG94_06235 [Methylocystis parvus OBBP]
MILATLAKLAHAVDAISESLSTVSSAAIVVDILFFAAIFASLIFGKD